MSKEKNRVNYNQYSYRKKPDPKEDVFVEGENDVVSEEVDVVKNEPVYSAGIVKNCKSLNVRSEPDIDGEIVEVIKESAKVMINETDSTANWFKVCTESGTEGFCMKQYIKVLP